MPHNLFVVGASVYPHNSGYNPTGPLAALALRLGDDLVRYHAPPDAAMTGCRPAPGPPLRIAAMMSETCRSGRGPGSGRGEAVFMPCAACHSTDGSTAPAHLKGIIGRKSGSSRGFATAAR